MNDYVELPDDQSVGLDSVRTIEAWVNPRNCATPSEGFTVIYGHERTMFFCEGRRIRFQSSSAGWPTAGTIKQIPFNEWTHVAITLAEVPGGQASERVIRIYINGYPEELNRSDAGDPFAYTMQLGGITRNIFLGVKSGTEGEWNGSMDEVRLWSDVRSAEEILANRDLTLTRQVPNTGELLAVYTGDSMDGLRVRSNDRHSPLNISMYNHARSGDLTNFDAWPHSPVIPRSFEWREWASDTDGGQESSNGYFGWSVAKEGALLVIGSPGASRGGFLGGNTVSGAIRWYVRREQGFSKFRKVPPNGIDGSEYGYSVDVHEHTVIVGAPGRENDRGTAHIYRMSPLGVAETFNLSLGNVNARFGAIVAIEDTVAVIAAPAENRVYSCEQVGNNWPCTVLPDLPSGSIRDIEIEGGLIYVGSTGVNHRGSSMSMLTQTALGLMNTP